MAESKKASPVGTASAADVLNALKPAAGAKAASPLVLDILPEEQHAIACVDGSANACSYKTSFLEDVAKLAPNKSRPLIVVGYSGKTKEAGVAAGRLAAAGYSSVSVYEPGLLGWSQAGKPIKGKFATEKTGVDGVSGSFVLNLEKSRLGWVGRNILKQHNGTLGIKSGAVKLEDGRIVSGEFVIDMNKITNEDLPEAMKPHLIGHLRSDDFFAVDKYPEAKVVLSRAKPVKSDERLVERNLAVEAKLTLRGVTDDINFEAAVATDGGDGVHLTSRFDFDRTKFNVLYGSRSFFAFLGMHFVSDLISIELNLFFDKKKE